jgi:ankyrin repeat protein
MVQLLIESEAEVNIPNEQDMTPIFFAVRNGNLSCVIKLIKAKAQINYKSLE